ncbi:MAG: RNA polymerase sigma factor [Thermoanaerobaculia bacterium]|nr:RNA polymerase sigma factor [Thermoanaerobaculia bacterium]
MLVPKHICDGLNDLEIIRQSLKTVDYFSCLYERYEEKLLRYIKRISFTTDDEAADILQEAFIKIWKNLNAFDQSLKLSSWIYRIVHNEAISFLRQKKSYGKGHTTPWHDDLYVLLPDETEGVAAEELEDRDKFTHRILAQLPPPYQEVLVLRFLENMSYEEISDILKIPEGTVAIRLNRAKKIFREYAGHPV